MKRFSLSRYAIVGLLAIPLGLSGIENAGAKTPRSFEFSPLDCLDASGKPWFHSWATSWGNFVLNKEIFNYRLRSYPEGEVTCRNDKQYKTLKFHAAMDRGGVGTVRITVFKGAKESGSYTITAGTQGTMLFDISGGRFFSIATTCETTSCSNVYFSRSDVETDSYNPGKRDK